MKLVEEDEFPRAVELLRGVWGPGQRVCERGEQLRIVEGDLRAAVVPLDARLGGVGPAVEFKVEFPDPHGRVAQVSLAALEELSRRAMFDTRQALEVLHAAERGEHATGGTAPAVAVSIEVAAFAGALVVLEVAHVIEELLHRGVPVVGVRGREVGEHAAAVDPLPEEGVAGRLVELVPGELLGEEETDARPAHDLRERARVSEDVRVPKLATGDPELLAEEALAVEELADERLARGDVAVGLDPCPSRRHEAPLGDAPLDLFPERGMPLLDPRVLLRL